MLGFMRKHAQSTAIKVIFSAIIIVFVFWGVGALVTGGDRVNVAATVDGEPISAEAYSRAVANMQRIYQQLYRENFSREIAAQLNLQQRALDDLVTEMLLKREATRLGLQVTDDEVRETILQIPAFQDAGRFERERYVAALRSSQLSPTQFEEDQRDTLLINKLESLVTDGIDVSDSEVRDLWALENEKIDVAFVKVPYAKFEEGITVSDQDVAAYYEKNQERFRQPERVTVAYVAYDPATFKETLAVSDDAIQAYYESHDYDFETAPTVTASRILIAIGADADDAARAAARTEADEVLGKLKDGGDFAALAAEHSDDGLTAKSGGDLGTVERGKLESVVEEAVFTLEPGAFTEVLETPAGFEILTVTAKQEAGVKPLAEVRDQIVATLRENGAEDAALAAVEQDAGALRDEGVALEEIAKKRGLEVKTSPSVARGQPIPGVKGPALVTAALGIEAGEIGEITGAEAPYYVFKVAEKAPSTVPPLADVKDQIVDLIREEKAKEAALAEAEKLLTAARTAGSIAELAKLAEAQGLAVEETGAFGRNDPLPKLAPAPIKNDLFALATASPFATKAYEVPGAAAVVVLKERSTPDESGFTDEKKTSLRDTATARRRQDVLESYRTMLRQRADISINPTVVTDLAG